MIKKFFFFIFILIFSSNLSAETTISFIDINYIIENSNSGKEIKEILKKKRIDETKKLTILQKEIKKAEEEIKKKNNILNEIEKKERINSIRKKIEEYKVLKNKKEKQFNAKKAEYINTLLNEINKIMLIYIEKNSIDLVVKKENLVTGKKELDITKVIFEELNKKKINFK